MVQIQPEKMVAMRDVFGETLLALSLKDPNILGLDGDLANSTKLDQLAERNAGQFLQMGIAEQNMLGVAAGLATVGYQPWVCSFAAFIVKRALDQIAVSVAQPKLDVKMIGAYSGLLTGCTGKTHQALEDLSIMRSLANMVVLAPADGVELSKMMEFAHQYKGPVYIRVARDPLPQIFSDEQYRFRLGAAVSLKEGTDATILSTGTQTSRAMKAAGLLEREGVSVSVLHMPSIKPIDQEAIVKAAERTGLLITAEEHNIYGGLGSAVAEVLVEHKPVPMVRIGVQDRNSESAPNDALLKKYNISVQDMVRVVKEAVSAKKR
ncbi:transketolase family protein [Brevibacillus borstelensis]|uniref:transketolase family protein n=1 Tax=Brevibacillus borstelensis TaxID=45462 RepID=UPI0030C3BD03